MPQIPQYNRQVSPTTQAPSATRSESVAGQTGQAMAQLGATLGQVADRMRKINALDKATTMQTNASRQMLDLQLKIKQNPQDWDYERIKKETGEIRSKNLSGLNSIPDKETQIRTRNSIDTTISSGSLKMQNTRMKFDVRQSQQKTYERADTLKEEYLNAESDLDRQTAIEKFNNEIKERVDNNVFTPNQGQTLKESEIQEWKEERIARHIERNPENAIAELKKGKKGEYGDLTADRRRDFLQQALSENKRQKEIQKLDYEIKQDRTEQEAVTRAVQGDLSTQEINEMEARQEAGMEGGISSSLASSLRKLNKSAKAIDPETKAATFNKLTADFSSLAIAGDRATKDNIKEIAEFRKNVMEARANDEINNNVALGWLKETSFAWNEETEEAAIDRYKNVKRGMDSISWWASNFYPKGRIPEVKAKLQQEFLKYAGKNDLTRMKDEQIYSKVDSLIKQIVREENPGLFNKEDIPNNYIDDKGNANRVYSGETSINPDEEYENVMGEKDEYGYSLGEVMMIEENGNSLEYEYIGNNQWRKIQ